MTDLPSTSLPLVLGRSFAPTTGPHGRRSGQLSSLGLERTHLLHPLHLSAPMSTQLGSVGHVVWKGSMILLALILVNCTGQDYGVLQPTPENLCKCLPIEPDLADYRHLAKHVPIPDVPIQEVSVETILGWVQDPVIPPDAPRAGRELGVFHIAPAFLQNASTNAADCDVVITLLSAPKLARGAAFARAGVSWQGYLHCSSPGV